MTCTPSLCGFVVQAQRTLTPGTLTPAMYRRVASSAQLERAAARMAFCSGGGAFFSAPPLRSDARLSPTAASTTTITASSLRSHASHRGGEARGGPGRRTCFRARTGFQVMAVVCHHGEEASSGHFTCFRRGGAKGTWWRCDDDEIVET